MTQITSEEERLLIEEILSTLSTTPFACSSLENLNGGSMNYVFRGHLQNAITGDEGSATLAKTIVVKRTFGHLSVNRGFLVDVTRCRYEKTVLGILTENFPGVTVEDGKSCVIRAPKLYMFDDATNTQVLEDLGGTLDVRAILESPHVDKVFGNGSANSVGRALGHWLRTFHNWTSAPEQAAVRDAIGSNGSMQKLKYSVWYDMFIGTLERYPQLLQYGHKEKLEQVQQAMRIDTDDFVSGKTRHCGLIHGDFWSGNVLMPITEQEGTTPLYVIDWELVQYGHRAIDIGGMLGDLYERKHFRGVDAAVEIMHGFIAGYGRMDGELAYETAIHAGVHIICWYRRRNVDAPLPYPLEDVLALLTVGRDLVLKGWERDREWLKTSILGPLFTDD